MTSTSFFVLIGLWLTHREGKSRTPLYLILRTHLHASGSSVCITGCAQDWKGRAMLGFLLSQQASRHGHRIFKGISGSSLCVSKGGDWLPTISDVQKRLSRGYATTTFFLGGAILSRHTLANSGDKSTIRLWLIFGEYMVGIDLPVIWLITLLKRLREGIATLGRGSGKALRKAGAFSNSALGGLVRTIRHS